MAGGETAGIPFAAWMADRLMLPMQYVRKKPKGFGRNAQIEGHLEPGERVLLVEDLTTDGRSKVNFCNALREAGATVEHCFVVFFYDIFPEGQKILATSASRCTRSPPGGTCWRSPRRAASSTARSSAEVEKFMNDPAGWSKAHGGVRPSGGVNGSSAIVMPGRARADIFRCRRRQEALPLPRNAGHDVAPRPAR